MRRNRSSSLFMVPILVSVLLMEPDATPLQSGRRMESPSFEQALEFNSGGVVRIENQSGSIRVETWSQNRVEFSASKPPSSRAYWQSLISVNSAPDVITLTVKPAVTLRVDLVARVPLRTRLELKTNSGLIETSGEPAALNAETVNGAVTIKLPGNYNADLSLATMNGAIKSEFPMLVHGRFDAHIVQGKIGRGGLPIAAKSVSGDISVMALPATAEQPAMIAQTDARQGAPASQPTVRTPPGLRTAQPEDEDSPRTVESARTRTRRVALPDDDAIKLEAPLVNLNVTVSDSSGKAITDLTKNDFTAYEDGVEQQITHFSPVTTPFDLVLLLDLSESTESKLKVIRRAAQKFVELTNPEDRVAVFTFTRRLRIVCPFTNNRFVLRESIEEIQGGGGTAFYDAMWRTLDELDRLQSRRKAIVVMTDGVDNSIGKPETYPSRYTFAELLTRVEESDVIIYPIYLDTEYELVFRKRQERPESYAIARRQLAALAERTAGTLYKADTVEDLEGVYEQVASELRTIYSLAYSPLNAAHDGKWRAIRIKINRPSAKVKSRRGYYAK